MMSAKGTTGAASQPPSRFGGANFNRHRRLPFLHSHVLIDGTDSFLLPGKIMDENSSAIEQHHIIDYSKARHNTISGKFSNSLLLPPLTSTQQPNYSAPSAQHRTPSSGKPAGFRKPLPQLKAFTNASYSLPVSKLPDICSLYLNCQFSLGDDLASAQGRRSSSKSLHENGLEPKVMLPFVPRPGETPRRIEIERRKKLYSQQNLKRLIEAHGISFPRPGCVRIVIK